MSTMTQTRRPVKPAAPKARVVTLALAIDHVVYSVTPIRGIEDPEILKAFRLEKKSDADAVYDVALTVHGLECSCPDFEARHRGLPTAGCKHVRALVELGLLERPAVVTPIGVTPAAVATNGCQAVEATPIVEETSKVQQRIAEPSPAVEEPAPAKVDAIEWANAIAGKAWEAASAEQRAFATLILNNDTGYYSGRRIVAPGRPVEELLAEAKSSVEGPCCSPAEPAPCVECTEASVPAEPADEARPWLTAADVAFRAEVARVIATEEPRPAPSPVELIGATEGGPECWPAWVDEDIWVSADEPRLSLVEAVAHEAAVYRARGTALGDFLAGHLAELARTIAFTGATTIEQFVDRRAAIDAV
jgi:hypothetical protein